MPNLLKDIEVFVISEELSNLIWYIVKNWNYFEKETIGKQLVKAADSTSANIAESHCRYQYKDKQNLDITPEDHLKRQSAG